MTCASATCVPGSVPFALTRRRSSVSAVEKSHARSAACALAKDPRRPIDHATRPAAIVASAMPATTIRVTGRRQKAALNPDIRADPPPGAVSALAKSSAVLQRSVGALARARAIAFSSQSGTPSRTSRSGGAFAANRREMITCAVGPTKGGMPAIISYSTQPSE